jgi:hypothetical protein
VLIFRVLCDLDLRAPLCLPETIIAFLAAASTGAIWSVCAPDMAAPAVIDRFK